MTLRQLTCQYNANISPSWIHCSYPIIELVVSRDRVIKSRPPIEYNDLQNGWHRNSFSTTSKCVFVNLDLNKSPIFTSVKSTNK